MTKIIEVSYSKSITRQISDYEPLNVFVSMKAEVGEDGATEAYKEIRARVSKIIEGEDEIIQSFKDILKKGLHKRRHTASEQQRLDEGTQEFINSLPK